MDDFLRSRLRQNSLNYKRSLDRIIDKYSKLHDQDGGVEVDLSHIKPKILGHYMKLSKLNLSRLESKSMTDLGEESIRAQDVTRDSQLEFTYQDEGANEASDTVTQLEVKDEEMSMSEVTQLTVSLLDESQRSFSQVELQPEDEDEELQMSLSSHGSSLVELYPSMISRIGRAWHRQHVSNAADSVLRRYRRWRQQSNRGNPNYTFVVPPRHTNSNSKKMTSKENHTKPMKRQFTRTETTPRSSLRIVTSLHDWQPQQQSPGKERGSQHHALLAMDFSDSSEISKPKEVSLNETFIVSKQSPPKLTRPREQASIYTVSPSRPSHPSPKASMDSFCNFQRSSLSSHSVQTAGSSMHASESSAIRERPDIYGSPVRPSPLKERLMATLSRSPHAVYRSPKDYSVESHSKESVRPRSLSTSLSTPPQRPVVPLRMLHHQDSHQLGSPQSAGRHKLRRHLSFDSSLKPTQYSPKKVDEDFMKLYHKFVCQNKSAFLNGPPCRLCARNSEASRGHSSSALAALALSPHRSILRKRHRELGWDSRPQSKRFREEYCTFSPGSRRHGREMLRRCLSPSEVELPHGGVSYSSSKHSMFRRFSTQQPPAHQESWMSQRQPVSAADFSSLGNSLGSKMADGYSPRKWR